MINITYEGKNIEIELSNKTSIISKDIELLNMIKISLLGNYDYKNLNEVEKLIFDNNENYIDLKYDKIILIDSMMSIINEIDLSNKNSLTNYLMSQYLLDIETNMYIENINEQIDELVLTLTSRFNNNINIKPKSILFKNILEKQIESNVSENFETNFNNLLYVLNESYKISEERILIVFYNLNSLVNQRNINILNSKIDQIKYDVLFLSSNQNSVNYIDTKVAFILDLYVEYLPDMNVMIDKVSRSNLFNQSINENVIDSALKLYLNELFASNNENNLLEIINI